VDLQTSPSQFAYITERSPSLEADCHPPDHVMPIILLKLTKNNRHQPCPNPDQSMRDFRLPRRCKIWEETSQAEKELKKTQIKSQKNPAFNLTLHLMKTCFNIIL